MSESNLIYGLMKVTEHGEWLESGRWYADVEDAKFRKESLAELYGIDGYIVTAEIGEVTRLDV